MTHTVVPDDVTPPLRRLEVARDALAERQAVGEKLRVAHAALDRDQAHRRQLRDQLTQARLDVERLERWSPAGLWSALRGARQGDLERGRAQVAETAAAFERTGAALEPLRAELDRLGRQAVGLDGADREYEAALEAVAAAGLPADDDRAADAVRELSRRRERREVEQARQAALSALQLLLSAHEVLSSAEAWSTWDTVGAGGRLSSDMKYERLDEAGERLREAGRGLTRLSRLVDDLAIPDVKLPEFGELLKELDAYWDVAIADWMVHTEITQCRADLDRAVQRVRQVLESLESRGAQLLSRLAAG